MRAVDGRAPAPVPMTAHAGATSSAAAAVLALGASTPFPSVGPTVHHRRCSPPMRPHAPAASLRPCVHQGASGPVVVADCHLHRIRQQLPHLAQAQQSLQHAIHLIFSTLHQSKPALQFESLRDATSSIRRSKNRCQWAGNSRAHLASKLTEDLDIRNPTMNQSHSWDPDEQIQHSP